VTVGAAKEGNMPKAVCPACGKSLTLSAEESVLYEQITCSYCDALLEVIDEDPPILEEIE
jgi:lysine biosynthesis protein LysW